MTAFEIYNAHFKQIVVAASKGELLGELGATVVFNEQLIKVRLSLVSADDEVYVVFISESTTEIACPFTKRLWFLLSFKMEENGQQRCALREEAVVMVVLRNTSSKCRHGRGNRRGGVSRCS